MLGLVEYSDSEAEKSDIEEEPQEGGVVVISTINESKVKDIENSENTVLFKALPKPKQGINAQVEEEVDEFLLKKELPVEKKPKKIKRAIKIGIPSLKDFESDEEDEEKKQTRQNRSLKSSGLFSILPPPKTTPITTKSFVPNILKKKLATPTKKQVKVPVKQDIVDQSIKRKLEDSDDEDIPMETFDDETWKQVCGRKKKTVRPVVENTNISNIPIIDAAPEAVEPYSGLDNEAFKKLVGSGKMKKENIKLVDVNEEEVMPERDVWMAKALTDPEAKPKYVVKDPVNDTCKKKHHITYLAQQAKANEQELQNQWSQSRFSRKQTQAKYGF